jgi:chemotaxis protein CheX
MKLPSVLDLAAARPLSSAFAESVGHPLTLDASGVERLGGVCLQVLLAAQARWRRDGLDFFIVEPSAAFLEGLRLMAAPQLAMGESAP